MWKINHSRQNSLNKWTKISGLEINILILISGAPSELLLTTAKKSTQQAGFVRPVSSNSKGLVEFKNKKVETLSPSFLNETVAFACHTIINIRQKVHKGIISVRNPPTTQVLKAVRYRLKSYSPKFPNAEEKCKQKIPGLYFITAALLQRIFV